MTNKHSARSGSQDNSSRNTSAGTSTTNTSKSLPPSVVLCNEAVFSAMVTRVVNDTIFPRQQFIILEHEMDVQGKLATNCLQEMKMDESQWHAIKEPVQKQLNRTRNNRQQAVRKSLLSKFCWNVLFISVFLTFVFVVV